MGKRTIRGIFYLGDRVVVDYGDHKIFQFCKTCRNGKHLRAFLSHFCPKLDLSIMNPLVTIAMERKRKAKAKELGPDDCLRQYQDDV